MSNRMNYSAVSCWEYDPERCKEISEKTKEFFMVAGGIKKSQFLKYSMHFLIA